MKVAELLQEKAGIGKLGAFPRALIKTVYQRFYLNAKTKPEPASSKPTIGLLKDKIYLSIGDDGSYGALGILKASNWDRSVQPMGFILKPGETEAKLMSGKTMADHLKQFPKGVYFTVDYDSGGVYSTRYGKEEDMSSDRIRRDAHGILEYMNETFLPKLKSKAEEAIDRVYSNLRKVKNTKDPRWHHSSSEQEILLQNVANLQEIMDKGFNQARMEKFLAANDKLSHGWASIPTNWMNFIDEMKEPAARARFAKVILDEITKLDKLLTSMIEKPKD